MTFHVLITIGKKHQVSSEALEALYAETNMYMLASHLYWALWALIQVCLISRMCLSSQMRIVFDMKFWPHK